MIDLLFLLKLFVSVFVVVGLSLVTEYVSPKVAGILAGYPLGAAIALFFFGLEIGPDFAAQSAVYTLAGLVATQAFVYFYFLGSRYFKRLTIPMASLSAFCGYMLVAWLIHFPPLNRTWAVGITVASIFLFISLFRDIPNVKLTRRIRLSPSVLLYRAVMAATIILLVTRTAQFVGSRWAGLFSAFPITLFPLILIVNLTYGAKYVHTIIKNFPNGLGALIAYCFTVSIVYPLWGIYYGTAVSFASATAYLLIYQIVAGRSFKKESKSALKRTDVDSLT